MKRWSSSGIAVEVKVPTGDQGVASMRGDLPALPQHAGVGVEPTLDIESDGENSVVGLTLFLGTYMVWYFKNGQGDMQIVDIQRMIHNSQQRKVF